MMLKVKKGDFNGIAFLQWVLFDGPLSDRKRQQGVLALDVAAGVHLAINAGHQTTEVDMTMTLFYLASNDWASIFSGILCRQSVNADQ